jgi:integrase
VRSAPSWPICTGKGHARTSVSRKLSALRAFSRYLRREGWIENDPAALAVGPKREQKIPAHLSVDEMSRLLEMPDVSTALGRRDRAILELFYASGLRLSELVSLDLEEVNLRARMVRVMGKGAKERLVPFNTTTEQSIRTWLADRAVFRQSPKPKAQPLKPKGPEPKAESSDRPAVRQLSRGTSDRPECAAARRPVCCRVQHALRDQPARVAAFVCDAPARARR